MRSLLKKAVAFSESNEDFHLGATITIAILILAFMGAGFYIVVANY